MNKKLFTLKNYDNPFVALGDLHENGINYIADHLTSGTIPNVEDIISLIKNFVLSETTGTAIDICFIDCVAKSGTSSAYLNKFSSEAVVFEKEIENLSYDFSQICLLEENKDMWDIMDKMNGAINYLEYRINKSELSTEEKMILLSGVSVLFINYNYWVGIFNTSYNAWKTWWLSVAYDVDDVRLFSSNGDWIKASYNGAIEGFYTGKLNGLGYWGSVAGSLFAAAICSIYPAPLQ